MGFFTRVFGKGTPESETCVEKEIEQVTSGEVNKVYPILKPGDWVGLRQGALRQTLVGTQDAPQVVIGFGYDAPSNFIFLTYQDLERLNDKEVLTQAFKNLEEYPVEFEATQQFQGRLLTCSGKDLCSEKILSQSFMLRAHELLNTKKLLVSVPRRRCMMVISSDSDKQLLDTFGYLHAGAWKDDSYGNAPIANMIFVLEEGLIVGIIPLDGK